MTADQTDSVRRLHIEISGAVQGVGFRPFVYRTEAELGLSGWVHNGEAGVVCEVEACGDALDQFVEIVRNKAPPLAQIDDISCVIVEPTGAKQFEIRNSQARGPVQVLALPDIATCDDCQNDIFNPDGRRYLFPFTNCTNCGPRYSIIERLPYDRASTAMADFTMCSACRAEYTDPSDRRFHAQPNCCPQCGPQLSLWDGEGHTVATRHDAMRQAATLIRDGKIVAVKGLGGFLLMADARNESAVSLLRERKHRPDKPFAIMCPELAAARTHCHVSAEEARLMESPQSPIVLLARRRTLQGDQTCEAVAPNSPNLGILLPYTPLHHILMRELEFPVVATSGNRSNEPLAYGNEEALRRLEGIADFFLLHDRAILAPVDDSVVRVMGGAPRVLRRARGYSPASLQLAQTTDADEPTILGLGGHLASTACLLRRGRASIGPHIGDLETLEALDAFERSVDHLRKLSDTEPGTIACDLHSDYHSSRYGQQTGLPVIPVQHHVAHIAACMAEHGLEETVLGIAWDGAGLGDDGTLWGGEFFRLEPGKYQRIAHLRQLRLPGGEAAIREPRRAAVGLLWELDGSLKPERADLPPIVDLSDEERQIFSRLLDRDINAPITSGAGRLFDAVAGLTGLRLRTSYQGQAATELEWAIKDTQSDETYPFALPTQAQLDDAPLALDWGPMMLELLDDLLSGVGVPTIAAKFHNTLVEMIASVVEWQKIDKVVFGGGCFQNAYLTERVMQRLRAMGVSPFFPQAVPTNDGGLSLGQVYWARHILKGE